MARAKGLQFYLPPARFSTNGHIHPTSAIDELLVKVNGHI